MLPVLFILTITDTEPGLPDREPEPPFLAGAGAVFLVRLLLLLYCEYFIFTRDPKYDYGYDYGNDYGND